MLRKRREPGSAVGRLDFPNTEPAEAIGTKRLGNLDTRLVRVLGLELDREARRARGAGIAAAAVLRPDRDRSAGEDGPLLRRERAVDGDQPSPHYGRTLHQSHDSVELAHGALATAPG